jgi:hypothetical protein
VPIDALGHLFLRPLYCEVDKNGWTVISMKNDWVRIFAFE